MIPEAPDLVTRSVLERAHENDTGSSAYRDCPGCNLFHGY